MMVNILVLGASGLIGHTLIKELSSFFNVCGTLHKNRRQYGGLFLDQKKYIDYVDVKDLNKVKDAINITNPNVILNCIGITKRKVSKDNIGDVIYINALFPHLLAQLAKEYNFRVIHFSTDCVFNGDVGNYKESDLTTAEDIYGRTKALGELINYDNCLTIRSSFIGQELFDKTELLDWFLLQEGKTIKGFTKTFYSGVSTIFMTRVIKDLIVEYPYLSGLYQLAPIKPISKYDLLNIAKEKFGIDVEIIPDADHIHMPTLDSSKLRNVIKINVPSWDDMMEELAKQKEKYNIEERL